MFESPPSEDRPEIHSKLHAILHRAPTFTIEILKSVRERIAASRARWSESGVNFGRVVATMENRKLVKVEDEGN